LNAKIVPAPNTSKPSRPAIFISAIWALCIVGERLLDLQIVGVGPVALGRPKRCALSAPSVGTLRNGPAATGRGAGDDRERTALRSHGWIPPDVPPDGPFPRIATALKRRTLVCCPTSYRLMAAADALGVWPGFEGIRSGAMPPAKTSCSASSSSRRVRAIVLPQIK
jgi:hypothetical protein